MQAPSPIAINRRLAGHVDQIYADIKSHFINARFDIMAEERRARTRNHVSILMRGFQIDHYDMVGGDLIARTGDMYYLGFLSKGGVLVKARHEDLHNVPGGAGTLHRPDEKFSPRTTPNSSGYVLCLPPSQLLLKGKVLFGEDFELSSDQGIDMRNAAGMALVRNVVSMFNEVSELEKIGLGHLASNSFSELITNLALASMFPDQWQGQQEERHELASGVVKRAEDLIRARAHEPLTIGEIASELGITARALQLGFRKHLGQSPLQFLLSRRLMLARERLMDPQFNENVQYVAMSCGFMNMSKFSTRYRAAFGELPSATLMRARGH